MSVRIISDSSCDIWKLEGLDFVTVPLTISTDERTFVDDDSLDIRELLSYMKKYEGRSYTACPSVQKWMEAYEGADEIYVVCMTSVLSGTYNAAVIAKDMYLEDHPDAKIVVFDTLSTATQQVLFLENLADMVRAGLSFDEICKEGPKFLKDSYLFFAFNSLHNLAQNGRVNKVAASTVGILGLSILGTASKEGTLVTTGKCRGEKKTIQTLYEYIINAGYCGGKVRITHIENPALAEHLADYIRIHYPMADIQIYPSRGLVAFYGEEGGIIIGCDTLDSVVARAVSRLA